MADIILVHIAHTSDDVQFEVKPYIITKKLVFAEDSNLVFLYIIQGFTSKMHIGVLTLCDDTCAQPGQW